MSQPQPRAHVFCFNFFCERCGQPAERVVDMPEAFGSCWQPAPSAANALPASRPIDNSAGAR